MPKPTFQQIAPEKRRRIIEEAARLFAERGFNNADVAELARRAGVAKGSLYNYFESKEDLYVHVCRDGLERSRRAVYGDLDPAWDIYRQVDHIFRRGARFAREHPEYVTLYLNVSAAGMERFADRLSRDVEKPTADHLKRLIRREQQAGRVRADLEPRLGALFINSLYVLVLVSLVSRHFQIRLREYLDLEGDLSEQAVEDPLRRTIGMIHQLLRPGQDEPQRAQGRTP
jgi:AcrR family transcriptional regulator